MGYYTCPTCDEEMKHWIDGIFECENDCGTMIDADSEPLSLRALCKSTTKGANQNETIKN